MNDTMENILQGNYENHVLPFFWQKGGEDDQIIIEYIEQMENAGIKAFCVESRPFDGFCEAPWWGRLDLIIREAKKRNMQVWILDDFHFPTGYANGNVKNYPGLNKKVLKQHVVNVVGPCQQLAVRTSQPFPEDKSALFLGAVAISGTKVITLENKSIDGYLYFDLPKGRWDIFIFNISSQTDVAPDYINMMDRQSCRILIKEVYEKHYERYAPEFGKTIAGFFSDEPGFQNEKGYKSDSLIGKKMPLPWSSTVEKQLKQSYPEGYLQYLPHLWRNIDAQTPIIRKNFMDIVTTLYQHNFVDQVGDWCHEHQVKYIGHIIEDRESHARLGVGAGHFYRSMHGQDMAGSDIISNQLIPGLDEGYHSWARGVWDGEFFHYALARMTSSLARIDAKKQGAAMAEVFGAYGWHEGLKLMKWIIDHLLVRGINNFVPHAFSPTEFPDADCPPHFYAHGNNPQFRYFKQLMTYTNKMGTLFTNGTTISDVAIMYHAEAEWTGKYMSCQKPAKILTQNQISFDIIPNDVFKVDSDYLIQVTQKLTLQGNDYRWLIIPYCEYLDGDLYNFICQSEQIKVIFLDGFPRGTFSSNDKFSIKQLQNKSQVLKLSELQQFINHQPIKRIKTSKFEPYLRYFDYHKDGQSYYMFFNEHPYDDIETTVEGMGKQPLYKVDLLNQQVTKLQHNRLSLAAYESCIITDRVPEGQSTTKELQGHLLTIIAQPTVSFATAQAYPRFTDSIKVSQLIDLSKNIKPRFTGTARYEFNFMSNNDVLSADLILEQVYETAEVYLNGKLLGSRICPPYRFSDCRLKEGRNTLVIDITNTLDKVIDEKHSAARPREPFGLLKAPIIKY